MREQTYILVIDDEMSLLDSFSALFVKEGYQITCASSWNNALAHLKARKFNIVLADVKLPDINYQQLIEQVKEENKYAFVITTAGFSDIEIAMDSVRHGATDYISKPFDPSELVVIMRKMVEKQRLQSENMQLFDTIKVLALALDARDHYTHGHSEQVTEYSVAVARELKLSLKEIEDIRDAGLLHDIGKIGIPDAVLLKPGKLNDDEFKMIKQHPIIGRKILEPISSFADKVPLVYHHHERFDGNGYPDKLKGEEIPLGARILAVADAYQAMTSDRPYRKALSRQIAVDELERNKGTQFDPKIVEVFLRIVDKF